MVDQRALETAWQVFLDAIQDAEFLSQEIANCDAEEPRYTALIAAWHNACRRREDAREVLRTLMGWR